MIDYDNDEYSGGGLLDALTALDIHGGGGVQIGDSGLAVPCSGVPPSGEPDLGEDLLDVRRRVAAAAAAAAQQIDLNEEHNLADLEDAGLRAHRETAREGLQDYNQRQQELPAYAKLKAKSIAGQKAFGALLRICEEKFMEARCSVEYAHRASASLAQLRQGKVPHGYPESLATDGVNALARLQKEVKASAQQYEQTLNFFETLKNALYDIRRENDALVAGLDALAILARARSA